MAANAVREPIHSSMPEGVAETRANSSSRPSSRESSAVDAGGLCIPFSAACAASANADAEVSAEAAEESWAH